MAGFSFLSYAVLLLFASTSMLQLSRADVFVSDVADAARIQPMGGAGSLLPHQCGRACDYRCSQSTRKKPCIFFCNVCCSKCLCVPSGTRGHKKECPCYKNLKTKDGKPKCP